MLSTSLTVAAAMALMGVSDAASLEQWKSRSIYQVMVDRFARTDGSTTATCDDYVFCNGSWAGLIDKLDYISDMGFTAIQISPVVENIEDDTGVGTAYHGYWSKDLYAVNSHFGTADDLKSLSDELHKRDMYLMVDVVVNNMAQKFDNTLPPPIEYSEFEPFDNEDYFHTYCNVTEWTNSTNYQNCWLYPYAVALADLRTEDQTVSDMLGSWIKELVANYSIDGLRIDAAKHVNDDFLPTFVQNSGVFAFGEVLTGLVEDFCRYQTKGLLPGMPNYLHYYPLLAAFDGGSMNDLATVRSQAQEGCNDTMALGTFVENHDMPRFASTNEDVVIAKNAMAYVILNDGMPLVYQGQEQHFNGSGTPFNREPLWHSEYNTSAELYQVARTLNKARNQIIALSNSSTDSYVNSVAKTLFVDINHLCMSKGPDGAQIVSCIVNQGSGGAEYELSVGGFSAGDEVVELLSCTTTTADGTGNVTMYMNKGEPKAYTLLANLDGTEICNSTKDAAEAAAEDSSAAAGLGMSFGMGAAVVFGWLLYAL
ncbi:glycoside hydrolase family 13 protein [Pseudomassariella vexata]|uniref:alpha-amylase n=1 Tax=Pseudomassariella vexata TaxID=1141098 RepID=A0A1Y2DQP7_9PEZI|nr:glycoside hydrolase family 13 protein [Pseudomassariella vexata]ORY61499.1 glycoside hydrolase family 13 protein [Pseudomassariella vexata]